jgi:hypothetical protein
LAVTHCRLAHALCPVIVRGKLSARLDERARSLASILHRIWQANELITPSKAYCKEIADKPKQKFRCVTAIPRRVSRESQTPPEVRL